MKVWILTRAINAYDQEGEYFEGVFIDKPTCSQLIECGVADNDVQHVLKGGGRINGEYWWYFLREQTCV